MHSPDILELRKQFPILSTIDSFSRSTVGYDDKVVYYSDKYFIYEKKHVNFDGTTHMNKTSINRQKVLKDNSILHILKDNYFKYIPKVYDFNDDWVIFENIKGPMVNFRHRKQCHLPPTKREEIDIPGTSLEIRTLWDSQVKEGIQALHDLGICHTDLGVWNLMVEKSTHDIKIIDLLSCVHSTDELIKLDWQCYKKHVKPSFELGIVPRI